MAICCGALGRDKWADLLLRTALWMREAPLELDLCWRELAIVCQGARRRAGETTIGQSLLRKDEPRRSQTRSQSPAAVLNSARRRPDCVAEVVGFELRNVVANYPFEKSLRFAGIQPNSGHRDYS